MASQIRPSKFHRWKRWVSDFELFIAASAVTCDTQKRALLLHCDGPNAQDIFGTLSNTGSEYAIALSKLNIYFTPIVNVPYTRHVFRQMKQNEGATLLQFMTRLRIVANDCDYGNNKDDFVRDQVIEKCLQKSLRVKLLSERELRCQNSWRCPDHQIIKKIRYRLLQ